MVPVSPARTTGSSPRIEVMGKSLTTSFPGRLSYISLEQHLVIHDSAKAEQAQHNLNTLHCIITCCCLLFRTQGVQLNIIADSKCNRDRHTRGWQAHSGRQIGPKWWREVSTYRTRRCPGSAQSVQPREGAWTQTWILPVVPMVLFTWPWELERTISIEYADVPRE